MPEYKDNRKKFRGIAPWEVSPATPRFDNPKKYDNVVRQVPAIRAPTPPRDAFRVASAPKLSEAPPVPISTEEPVPDADSWDL